MIIVGIDPGLKHLGLAAVESENGEVGTLVALGLSFTEKENKLRATTVASDTLRRLDEMCGVVCIFLAEHKPSVVVMEAPSWPRNASAVGKIAMSFGAVVMACKMLNLPYVEVSPKDLKKHLTGNANSTKEQMLEALGRKYNNVGKLLHSIKATAKAKFEHPVDAAACAYYAATTVQWKVGQ